ncbi:hypothetical protein C6Q02_01100 [Burkholderia multivorans]|uniref:hypothetical protein n=1 Tax=Burkholderia multivorans TaxID=87883 RepID=UPI000CFF4224|nr:hypothetical protein [Burkholderia multivorans]PRE93281.1 hypothetical protein C6Q02_01100 [Burkholderia multivorans]
MKNKAEGIKKIQIHAKTNYPIVSAYEFEFLKSEQQIQNLIKPCTIYFIIQRPLLYFDKFEFDNGDVKFEITDDSAKIPLQCRYSAFENGLSKNGEDLDIHLMFYKRKPDEAPPYTDIAGFKIFDREGKFLWWHSPQNFLYGFLDGRIKADIVGNVADYIDYHIHYIGKAFDQDIWDRLTGHKKMQSILTLEDSLSKKSLRAPFEISLLMLDIDGFDEANIFPPYEHAISPGAKPIVHYFTDDEHDHDGSFAAYWRPKLDARAPELTAEVEALLVSTFKPIYNEIKFDNYPEIKSGTRSAGYTESSLLIEKMPAILSTEHHKQGVVLPKR